MRIRESDAMARSAIGRSQISPGVTLRFLCDGCNKPRMQLGRKRVKHRGASVWRCAVCLTQKEAA